MHECQACGAEPIEVKRRRVFLPFRLPISDPVQGSTKPLAGRFLRILDSIVTLSPIHIELQQARHQRKGLQLDLAYAS